MKIIRTLLLALMLACAGTAFAADQVNINTADAEAIMKILKGVGPEKAAAIVDFRNANGPFKSADDLAMVKGIGKRLVEINREKITVGEAEPEN